MSELPSFELTAADFSLLSWVYQSGISAHSLSIQFHQDSLVAHCQTLEEAMKLWEKRSILQMPGKELCFQVDGKVYVGSAMG